MHDDLNHDIERNRQQLIHNTIAGAEQLVDSFGYKESLRMAALNAGYTELPPTISEVLDSTHFAKEFIGDSLYPIWRRYLEIIYPDPLTSPYREVITTGAIGTGKSTLCMAGMFYDLIRLHYLKSIHTKFQFNPGMSIVIAFINTTLGLSQSVLVKQFVSWVQESPYLREQRLKHCRTKRELLPHKMVVVSGSRGTHLLGRGVVMAILSELNFQGEHIKEQAARNYASVKTRMETRFGRGEGLIFPGRMWLDSSKSDETGFLEDYLRQVQGTEDVCTINEPIWNIHKETGKIHFSGDEFPVFIGDGYNDARILEGPKPTLGISPELIIWVPEYYRKLFEFDLYTNLRDLAGVSTWSLRRFMPHEQRVRDALKFENPAKKEVIVFDETNKDEKLIDYVEVDKIPKQGPYFLHYDIGVSHDRTGIALTRCLGEISINRASVLDFTGKLQTDLIFETVLVLAIQAKPGQQITLGKLKGLIPSLIASGIPIAGVSADQFQSTDLLQYARELGIQAEVISVDRKREPYDGLKDAILESRWSGPVHPVLFRELLGLKDMGRKIDHDEITGATTERPSKDVADAVAGSYFNCREHSRGGKSLHAFNELAKHMAHQQKVAAEEASKPDAVLKNALLAKMQKQKSRGKWSV